MRIDAAVGPTFLILVTNNSDEAFEIAGASVAWEGSSLSTIARPLPGSRWTAGPRGQSALVRWPDQSLVMENLVSMNGLYDQEYVVPIDFTFDCVLDDERREIKKRIRVQVDPVNRRAVPV